MRNKKFLRLVALFAAYVWFNTFSKAILPVYFIKHGFLPSQIIFGAFLFYFAIALFVVLFRNFKAKTGWYLAVVFQLLYMLLLLNISSTYVLYFASFISGIATFFFYIPYNIAHYENTPENKNGISSSIMTNMWPVIGMAAPLLAGFLAQYNYSLIWIFTAIFCVLPIIAVGKQENFKVKYSLKEALSEIKSTKIFTFFYGFWDGTNQFIPIFSLFFIKTPLYFGTYLAYLSLVSVAANYIMGAFTDKVKKRSVFLYPITIITGIVTFFLFFAVREIGIWILITGAVQFMNPLVTNLSIAIVADSHSDKTKAMAGRELVLDTGRMLSLFLVFLSLTFEKIPQLIFIPLAASMFLFSAFLFYNTKISKKYSYF